MNGKVKWILVKHLFSSHRIDRCARGGCFFSNGETGAGVRLGYEHAIFKA